MVKILTLILKATYSSKELIMRTYKLVEISKIIEVLSAIKINKAYHIRVKLLMAKLILKMSKGIVIATELRTICILLERLLRRKAKNRVLTKNSNILIV